MGTLTMGSLLTKVAALTLSLALLGSACGSDEPTEPAAPRGWTADELADAPRYGGPGPHAVGIRSLELPDGNGGTTPVVIWYPADGPGGTEPVVGVADAAGDDADGPYPLVLFAHGLGLAAADHSRQLAHAASWGFVVAAPENTKGTDLVALGQGVRDAAQEPDTALTGVAAPTGPIAVGGHSSGTTYAVASSSGRGSDEVVGALLVAGGGPAGAGEPVTSPSLFLAGARDPATDSWVRSGFEIAAEPTQLVVIQEAGHLTFTDVCVGERTSFVSELDCAPSDTGDEALWPLIHHATVAFLRWRFGLDDTAMSLDPTVLSGMIDTPIAVEGSFVPGG